jgi:hypothetical protein
MIAAADPHVPGPGRKRPIPKKVAMTVAQIGGRVLTISGEVVIRDGPDLLAVRYPE